MPASLRRSQTRVFGALLVMLALYLAKDWLFRWLMQLGLFAVYVPPNTDYASALRMDRAVLNGFFLYEVGNYLLSVWLITSLKQATGFLPGVVRVIAYLLAALYVAALAVSFLPVLLPRFTLLG